jgi:hypothetical protein
MGYAIRLLANRVLQDKIGYLHKRPVRRPPHEVRRVLRQLPPSGTELGWPADAALPSIARSPTNQRMAGSRHSRSASSTSP